MGTNEGVLCAGDAFDLDFYADLSYTLRGVRQIGLTLYRTKPLKELNSCNTINPVLEILDVGGKLRYHNITKTGHDIKLFWNEVRIANHES